jgi:hypothetical protein
MSDFQALSTDNPLLNNFFCLKEVSLYVQSHVSGKRIELFFSELLKMLKI